MSWGLSAAIVASPGCLLDAGRAPLTGDQLVDRINEATTSTVSQSFDTNVSTTTVRLAAGARLAVRMFSNASERAWAIHLVRFEY